MSYVPLLIGLVLLLTAILGSFALYHFKYNSKQSTQPTQQCVPTASYMQCLTTGYQAGIESFYDVTIPPPASTLSMKFFSKSLGYPWCIPTRYALRYVTSDGSYGPLSEWSDTVVASPKADSGCSSNVPEMEVESMAGILGSYPVINVHRQVQNSDGTWPEDNDTELVGSVLPIINQFIDIDNPNASGTIIKCNGC